METAEQKRLLRAAMRERLRQLDPEEKFLMDMAIHRNLAAHPWFQEADTILSFCSLKDEPDTHWIIGWALANGRTLALPVCLDAGIMRFCCVRAPEEIVPGKYGILEPAGREEPAVTEKTLCIVPAFAFTADGRRLGKGGGYYDRYLAAHPGLRTIGLTYRHLLAEELPCEVHDMGVNEVITDQQDQL